MSLANRIVDWVHSAIESESYRVFDDLHVDSISDAYKARESWVNAFEDISVILRERKADIPNGFVVPISVSLTSDSHLVGIQAKDIRELAAEFSFAPPSLYVFKESDVPWRLYPDNAQIMPPAFLPWNRDASIMAIHFEYREPLEMAYRRSLSVIT